MSDYKVTVKVQNNNIVRRIIDAGYKTVGEFCRLNKIMNSANSTLGEIINLKESPLTAKGDFKSCIKNAAFLLGCSPEDFFTESQLQCALETNKHVIEVAEAELQFVLENKVQPKLLEDEVMNSRLPDKISHLLRTLTPREAKIISMRYGVSGANSESTIDQVASVFGCTRERIRQIEAKALRKLRHPSRAEYVRDYVEAIN